MESKEKGMENVKSESVSWGTERQKKRKGKDKKRNLWLGHKLVTLDQVWSIFLTVTSRVSCWQWLEGPHPAEFPDWSVEAVDSITQCDAQRLDFNLA